MNATTMQSAVLEGVLSGIVVFASIFVSERLERSRGRTERIRACLYELTGSLSEAAAYLSGAAGEALPPDAYATRGDIVERLTELRTLLRGRGETDALVATEDILARVIAAYMLFERGKPLGEQAWQAIGVGRLTAALRGQGEPTAGIEERVRRYLEGGLPSG